ncbi:MAG: amino acid transporter substrate-binding protein [Herminiimonas sp.]|nr:amino acid transporter substrate-binding protein [Herminiimonas sp.]MDB5854170.1 amino acid transporter substrate-binding protein [Herminiimonas sp.]
MVRLSTTSAGAAIFLTASCLLATSGVHADTLSKIRSTKTIVVGYQEGSVPFSFIDDNSKKPVGYAVELCQKFVDAVQKELKLPSLEVVYLPVNSSNRIPAIVDGKADIECGTTTNTPDRRKQVAFTIPHFVAAAKMLVKTDSNIKNWNDLRGKKVVITKGAVQYKVVKDRNETTGLNMTIVDGRDHMESFRMLERGEVAAFPMGDVVLYGLRAKAKDPAAFQIVGDPLSAEPYASMFRKDDPAFKTVIDTEMARLMTSGELTKLYDKWFRTPQPAFNNASLNMPMSYLLRDSMRFPSDKVGQ